jgi:hypothetical protein
LERTVSTPAISPTLAMLEGIDADVAEAARAAARLRDDPPGEGITGDEDVDH